MRKIAVEHLPLANLPYLTDKVKGSERLIVDEDSGIIRPTSEYLRNSIEHEVILNKALAKIRKKRAFEQIITEYPSLKNMAQSMTYYFTDIYPSDGDMSLLCKSLQAGIDGFFISHSNNYDKHDPTIKISAFIIGCSSVFHEILLCNVYGKYENTWVQWKPLTEPIGGWISRYQFQHVLIAPTFDRLSEPALNAAANKLMYEFFDFSDLAMCGISEAPAKILA